MAVTKQLSRTLAACLAACAAAALVALFSPVRALAEQTGNLTVTSADGSSASLDAYQLFSGDVYTANKGEAGEHRILSNISWGGSDPAKTEAAVNSALGSLRPDDFPVYTGTTAEDAANWIRTYVEWEGGKASSDARDEAEATASETVATAIKTALAEGGVPPTTSVETNKETSLPTGYWLLSASDESVGAGEAGSRAMLVTVGDGDVTVSTKASVPTVEKQVLENSNGAWQKQADATVADELDWRLEATVPVDLSDYKTYSVTFHDVLSAGIAEPSGVRVYVAPLSTEAWEGGADPATGAGWVKVDPSEYSPSYDASGDDPTFDLVVRDLKKAAEELGFDVAAGIRVCVVYDAPLTQAAARGVGHGNPNTVTLEYPASPYTDARGETQEDEAIAYTWDLDLVKRSSVDQRPLAGAVLRVTDDRGYHLTQEGTWTEDDATVTTDEDGTVAASGVDSGTFRVEEVAAPAGYVGITGALEVRLRVSLEADRISHHLEQASDSDDLNPGEWRLVATSPLSLDSFDPDASGVATAYVPNAPEGTTPPAQGGGTGGAVGEALRRVLPRTPSTGDPTSYVPAICLAVVGVALIAFAVRRMRGGTGRRH